MQTNSKTTWQTNEIMIEHIDDKIGTINEQLAWLQKAKPEQYEQRFVHLVQERYRLKIIRDALKENPSIAAYGEKHGAEKTNVIENLLQHNGQPFKISLSNGETIDFARDIYPIGHWHMSTTGVVTRFTAFIGENACRYEAQYPVFIKLLSVIDIAIILCDSWKSSIPFIRVGHNL